MMMDADPLSMVSEWTGCGQEAAAVFSNCHLCCCCCCSIALLLLFVSCLASQQHTTVSQGRICFDKFTCCHIEIEVADQAFYLTKSRYTDT